LEQKAHKTLLQKQQNDGKNADQISTKQH